VSGMTLTPVAPPSAGVEVEQPPASLLTRMRASSTRLRRYLFGRGLLFVPVAGERTPLVGEDHA
jgi:hypothetical protein